MPTYLGITFRVDTPKLVSYSLFGRNPNHVVTHIPYSSIDDKQDMGLSDEGWEGQIYVDSVADYSTLKAGQGFTKRTLTNWFGATIVNVMLEKVGRGEYFESDTIVVPVTFRYEA